MAQVDGSGPKGRRPVVMVANPSADVYGSDLQMLESVTGLVEHFDVVVTTPDSGPLVAQLARRGATVERVAYPVLRRAYATPRGLLRLVWDGTRSVIHLVRLLRRRRPDVVYVNTVTLPWWLLAARLSRTPVACHVHEAERLDGKIVRLVLYAPLLLANRVIVNSEVTGDTVAEAVPALRKRCVRVYNGVAGPTTAPGGPPESVASFGLVLISRLSPRKGIDVAFEAVASVRKAGYDVRLELCGTPFDGYEWFEAQLRERASDPDLEGSVTFSGYTTPIWPALARSHAALATSLGESLGNAVIEAQLAERPVIASAVSGHTETVADGTTGLLVPPRDPEALADAIISLVDDRALARRLAAQGRQEALRRFSLDRYRTEICDVMHQMAHRSGSR